MDIRKNHFGKLEHFYLYGCFIWEETYITFPIYLYLLNNDKLYKHFLKLKNGFW